jgi:hypothetical protein
MPKKIIVVHKKPHAKKPACKTSGGGGHGGKPFTSKTGKAASKLGHAKSAAKKRRAKAKAHRAHIRAHRTHRPSHHHGSGGKHPAGKHAGAKCGSTSSAKHGKH